MKDERGIIYDRAKVLNAIKRLREAQTQRSVLEKDSDAPAVLQAYWEYRVLEAERDLVRACFDLSQHEDFHGPLEEQLSWKVEKRTHK